MSVVQRDRVAVDDYVGASPARFDLSKVVEDGAKTDLVFSLFRDALGVVEAGRIEFEEPRLVEVDLGEFLELIGEFRRGFGSGRRLGEMLLADERLCKALEVFGSR